MSAPGLEASWHVSAGLDTCLSIMRVLHSGTGDSKYRPCPLLVQHVDAGGSFVPTDLARLSCLPCDCLSLQGSPQHWKGGAYGFLAGNKAAT